MDSMKNPSGENYLKAVLEGAVLGKDPDGVIRYMNEAAVRLYGYSEAELLGRPGSVLIPVDRTHEAAETLERLAQGSAGESMRTVRLAKGGKAIHVSLRSVPIRDPSGLLVGVSEIARFEEHSQAEAQSYLAAIVESSDDAIISKDLDGVIRSFNAAAERMFGYKSSEVVGKPVTILIPHDRLPEEKEILRRLRRGERIEHFETIRLTKEGKPLDISLTVSPVRDATGTIVGASKVARDITESKRVTRELAAQGEWFRVTLGSIGDGVIASDRGGRVTFLNNTAEHLTGWKNAEAVGRPFSEVFRTQNERTRVRTESPADRVLSTGRTAGLSNHTVLLSRDGTEWPIDDSAAPILDESGQMLGVVLVFRDVTERRRAESDRQAAVLERDRLLERERSARSDAERANRVKDDFVAMVSHELRTPLNAILGWTDLLMTSHPDSATMQHGLGIVARNTRIQSQLISDLLDISRIVSGKLSLDIQSVDPSDPVEASLESVQHAAKEKGVVIEQTIQPDVGTILGDPARLQQIVWNLLTNAIKFTPSGGRVRVGLRKVGDCAEITVTDTGAGIRPEYLPDLFERFRHTGATTRSYGGLGLGLSIVKHLAELHGGSVRAHSAGEGKGATFTVEIPLAGSRTAPAAATGGEEESVAPTGDRVLLRGITALVVEDEHDTRELLKRLLEAHEAQVATAATAAEALTRLDAIRPDILISDIGLPEMDGYELIRRIRKGEGDHATLPAVALTAFARSEDRTRALRAGYQTHLSKPVEPSELVATVRSLVSLTFQR